MDYDDLLLNWADIMSFTDVRKKISERFSYVMIDEYQDTNKLQDKIIKKIAKREGNVLAVGDDSQSIYSFRAANIDNIINFSENYQSTKIFKLEMNYRSTSEILNMANSLISNNKKRLEKELKSNTTTEKEPEVLVFSNPLEQAEFIADYIENNGNLKETAVLFRAHFHAVELEMELTKRNIPYTSRGGVRFFEQFHVKDLIAFLRIFLNFRDSTSLERLFLRKKGVGEVTARKISGKISELDSLEQISTEKDNIVRLLHSSSISDSFYSLVKLIEENINKSIPEKIDSFLNDFYSDYLDFSFENSKDRKSDLKKIYEMSFDYEDLKDIISDFSLSEDVGDRREDDSVVLSTIHQAKGLEWETVFVVSLKEGDFPHIKAVEEDLIEEERRLFYVAVTRCKRNLFLTYPRYNFREKYIMPPSRFIKEAQGSPEDDLFFEGDEEIVESDDGWEVM